MRFFRWGLICVFLVPHLGPAQPVPGRSNGSTGASALKEYLDPLNGVSFRYPETWMLNQGGGAYIPPLILDNRKDPTHPYEPTAYVALEGRDARDGLYRNTNFINGIFFYRVAPDLSHEECHRRGGLPDQVTGDMPDSKVDWITIGGVRFRRTSVSEEEALCNHARQTLYAAFHGGHCYIFEKQINTICQQHGENGIRDITPRELAHINRAFDAVMLSVRFREGSGRSENKGTASENVLYVPVPQKIKIVRSSDAVVVSIDRDSLEPVELTRDEKLVTGVIWKLYVHSANAARPFQPDRTGMSSGTDFNLGAAILSSEDPDFPVPGHPWVIEVELTIIETPVPPQHLWNVAMGANYRALWQRLIKQTVK